jgi:hypothetical protein
MRLGSARGSHRDPAAAGRATIDRQLDSQPGDNPPAPMSDRERIESQIARHHLYRQAGTPRSANSAPFADVFRPDRERIGLAIAPRSEDKAVRSDKERHQISSSRRA